MRRSQPATGRTGDPCCYSAAKRRLITAAGLKLVLPSGGPTAEAQEVRYDFDIGSEQDGFTRGTLPINSLLAALAEAAPDGAEAAWARACEGGVEEEGDRGGRFQGRAWRERGGVPGQRRKTVLAREGVNRNFGWCIVQWIPASCRALGHKRVVLRPTVISPDCIIVGHGRGGKRNLFLRARSAAGVGAAG